MFCHLLSYTHLALWRGKRPKVNAKQKGFWNFLSFSLLFFAQYFGVEFKKNIGKTLLKGLKTGPCENYLAKFCTVKSSKNPWSLQIKINLLYFEKSKWSSFQKCRSAKVRQGIFTWSEAKIRKDSVLMTHLHFTNFLAYRN